jgi:hypothetical protein
VSDKLDSVLACAIIAIGFLAWVILVAFLLGVLLRALQWLGAS